MYERKATAFSPKFKANWNLGAPANQRISYKNVAVNSHKYTEQNREGALIILEISFEIIPNSIISYTRAQFT